jgi:hypothetical protein
VAEADYVRIELGFEGGQVMNVLVPVQAAEELEQALTDGADGALTIQSDDVRYTILLRRVGYLKRFARESRLGFGSGSGA